MRAEPIDWGVVQRQLKTQGLYYGEIDGHSGPETLAAVNRFQIRKGLPVTGEVDPATWTALTTGAKDAPHAPVSPPETARDSGGSGPTPLLSTWYEPVVTQSNTEALSLDGLFAETPLADTSASRKRAALRTVQGQLRQAAVYAGAIDGDPGPKTHQALLDYQAKYGLIQTAAVDPATLAAMQLDPATLGARNGGDSRSRKSRESDDNVLRRSGRTVGKFMRRLF